MQRDLDKLFKDAVNRKHKRLSFDTTYTHCNICDWLQSILTDWTILTDNNNITHHRLRPTSHIPH